MTIRALGPCALVLTLTGHAHAVLPNEPGIPVPPAPVPFRVVTMNVLVGVGEPGTTTYNALGDMVTVLDLDPGDGAVGLNPDIVLFQEVQSDEFFDLVDYRDEFLPGFVISTACDDFGNNYNVTLTHPDHAILDKDSIPSPGPRCFLRNTVQVPGADRPVTIWNAHFKAFGDPASQNTRTAEANLMGNLVGVVATEGLDLDSDGVDGLVDAGNLIVAGDLNSNNNNDGTLDGLFAPPSFPGLAVLNLPYETLAGAANPNSLQIATFGGGTLSRLDYICPDADLVMGFDADNSGVLDQDEINTIGFSYWSTDDDGAQANGNEFALSFASDHRPVVADFLLEGQEGVSFDIRDLNENGLLDIEDLQTWESLFAQGTAPDLNGDGSSDILDRDELLATLRAGEQADIGA